MAKRVNPRRRPANMADVERAKTQAQQEAVRVAWSIFMTVLYDKEHAEIGDVQRVWQEVNELSDSVAKGYVNVDDLCDTLKHEYDIKLV